MTLKKKILRDVRNSILRGEYEPGEHLKEPLLCERFKVSRTPVREALNQLEKEGFIEIIPGAGAKIVKHSHEEALKIYDVLIVLEGAASRLACPQISNGQIEKLEEYNVLFEKAMEQNNNELSIELNTQFHWMITEATKNPHLIEIRANIRHLADFITRIFPSILGQLPETLFWHQQIVNSFKSKNPALAEFVMREHLENAKEGLEKYFLEIGEKL